MFEKALQEKFRAIFGLKKVSYEEPGEVKEQEGIFITIDSAYPNITFGRETARVSGSFSIFANSEKLKFGYIPKCIEKASAADLKGLSFYNMEQNAKYFGNLVERKANFIFLYSGQYDPNHGSLDELDFTITEI